MEITRTIDRIPIDKSKFDAKLEELNMTRRMAATGIGFSADYLSKCLSVYDGIPKRVGLLLDSVYGIKYEDIKPDESKQEELPAEEPQTAPCLTIDSELTETVKELKGTITELIHAIRELDNSIKTYWRL